MGELPHLFRLRRKKTNQASIHDRVPILSTVDVDESDVQIRAFYFLFGIK